MVRVIWLLAACAATVALADSDAQQDSRLHVVVKKHKAHKGFTDALGDAWDSAKSAVGNAYDDVEDSIHDALHGSQSAEEDAGEDEKKKKSHKNKAHVAVKKHKAHKGFTDALGDAWDSAKSAVSDAFEDVEDSVHDALHGSHSGEEDVGDEKKKTTKSHKSKVNAVVKKHQGHKGFGDDLGDAWDSAKSAADAAIGSVEESIHHALYGSGSGQEDVGEEEKKKHKHKSIAHKSVTKPAVKEALVESEDGSELGSDSGSNLDSGSGSELGDDSGSGSDVDSQSGSQSKSVSTSEEVIDEEEDITLSEAAGKPDFKTPPPVKKARKNGHRVRKQVTKNAEPEAHAEATTLSTADADKSNQHMGLASYTMIGAAVGALVGSVVFALAMVVRRHRSAANASIVAAHESDVAALPTEEENAQAPVADTIEADSDKLEGSV